MSPAWRDLLRALRHPSAMAEFDAARWDLALRQATSAGLLARLASLAEQAGLFAALPAPVQRHMRAMQALAEQKRRAVHWELVHLSRDLAALEGPVLLLKGAAYAAAGLPPAAGRLFSDIDLLVPKAQLDRAEAALMLKGWVSLHGDDDYDTRYYRQWMHELPPMVHVRRQTSLDLHHNILPETARLSTRVEPILASATALPGWPRFAIPSLADLVIHSATHLFHEGEWTHGLRDLVDLDALLSQSTADLAFWPALLQRADALGLGRPLYYGLSLCRQLLDTPVPEWVLRECPGRPRGPLRPLMHGLFLRALSTAHPGSRLGGARLAAFCLYVRSHYLRMPLRLLLPHLLYKAWQRRRPKADAAGPPEQA